MKSLPRVTLPEFVIDAQRFEEAMNTPIREAVRFEMKISPDEARPSYIRRIVSLVMNRWRIEGDGSSLTALVIKLLFLYGTGQIHVGVVPSDEPRFSFSDEVEDDSFSFDPSFTEG